MKENDGEKSRALTLDIVPVAKAVEITRNKKFWKERKALNINNNFAISMHFISSEIQGEKNCKSGLSKPSPPHDAVRPGSDAEFSPEFYSDSTTASHSRSRLLRHQTGDTQAASGNIRAFLFPENPASAQ